MSAKPTIVMVPGAWHKPVIYSGVEAELSKHGYPTVSLPLHSAGVMPADESFDNDVATIRKRLVELVEEEKEVVLVVHSYSGLPGGMIRDFYMPFLAQRASLEYLLDMQPPK